VPYKLNLLLLLLAMYRKLMSFVYELHMLDRFLYFEKKIFKIASFVRL